MTTLHIHADEAGNLDFGPRGSRHYAFAVAWTRDPLPLARRLRELRFGLLKRGVDVAEFHAQPDSKRTRNAVFDILAHEGAWSFCAVVVNKRRVYPPLQVPQRFYPRFLGTALDFVFHGVRSPADSRALVYTDNIPTMRRKRGVEKAIKTQCAAELPTGMPFEVFHHPSASNDWLQVVDYCCWAVYRKYEDGDDSYYRRIEHRLRAPELFLWPTV